MSDRDLIERLMDVLSSDHKRGCDGRTYTCNCGYDDQVEQIADQATDRLQALSAEVEMYREALKPFVDGYSHTAVFLSSREKMHSCGRELYAQDVERARQALKGAQQ